ncbi:MAG: flagellar export chaperone FliS [Plesiomonas sp.]|uniref:flagellar export chaperone FliS n=1 Tax=Plesiomonas sp. TaxID=2486279 RepID=UPI003F33D08C
MRGTLQAYKKVSVDSQLQSASPHKVILMLLSGAIERLVQAKAAMQMGNIAVKGERLGKAVAIIANLQACLSEEEGGDIAKNLAQLYGYMQTQLLNANLNNDVNTIDEVITLLTEIKTGWESIPAELHYVE